MAERTRPWITSKTLSPSVSSNSLSRNGSTRTMTSVTLSLHNSFLCFRICFQIVVESLDCASITRVINSIKSEASLMHSNASEDCLLHSFGREAHLVVRHVFKQIFLFFVREKDRTICSDLIQE